MQTTKPRYDQFGKGKTKRVTVPVTRYTFENFVVPIVLGAIVINILLHVGSL